MKYFLFLVSVFFVQPCFSQSTVKWKFSAKKLDEKTYELSMAATVQEPWHIYSQFTPDGGPVATEIKFNKNPLLTIAGKPKEFGKMEEKYEDVFGISVKYFEGKVDFVQIVMVKSNIKTNLTGTIEFMLCNDHECMPPKKINFSVKLD